MTWNNTRFGALCAAVGLGIAHGCVAPTPIAPLDPIPRAQAVALVNHNIAAIAGTLRATGSVDGYFTTESGRRRAFHLDGTLMYLAPKNLRFDIKSLAGTEVLFGTNDRQYWYYTRQDGGAYFCFCHADADAWIAAGIPVEPAQIIDALGLTPIPAVGRDVPAQRVVDAHQQLFFIRRTDTGAAIEKEYWLDRFAPRLVRRVIGRDVDGGITMDSRIRDYRPLTPDGPLVPYRFDATWPVSGAGLTFQVARWYLHPDITPTSPQFTPPHELGLEYEHTVIETDDCRP